ncbi:MAG: hypothetical protein JWP01_348 [Myxococcales bacterium]|nr:hypothetical protein [Myxococcales bacterium]
MKAAVAVLLCALIGVAHADRKVALKFFRAGEKAYQAQNFEAAAHNFYAAYEALPLPEIAFSAAQAFRRQYRVEAKQEYVQRSVELYKFYLSKVKTGGRVADAADSLGEMERELDKLGGMKTMAPPPEQPTQLGVTVRLIGVVEDSSMREVSETEMGKPAIAVRTFIDGKPVQPDNMVDVEPADHVVRAEADGFAPIEKKEKMPKGRSELVELELQPLPARVTIATESDASVSIDGRGVGTTPLAELEVPAGRHVLTIVRRGREPVSRELVVERGQVVRIAQPLEATRRRASVKFVAGGAIGFGTLALVAAGAAIVQDGRASDRLEHLRTGNQSDDGGYADARDRRDRLVMGTWIFGATAVGLGIAAGVLYYFDTPTGEGLRVNPIAGSGVGGAAVIGRF